MRDAVLNHPWRNTWKEKWYCTDVFIVTLFIIAEKHKRKQKNSTEVFKYIMIYHPRVLLECQYNDKYENYQVTREGVLELH